MLHLMRKHAGTWMIKVILGAIIAVFVFWGVGSYRAQRAGTVARVNGTRISYAAYRQSYDILLKQVRQRFGENLNEETLKMLNIKQQALNRLIDRELLLAEADRLGVRVSDQELVDAISRIPAFQSSGRFNSRLYSRVLSSNHLSAADFETSQADAMRIERLQDLIGDTVRVSDIEARAYYDWRDAKVSIDYAVFAPARYKDLEPSAEALQSWYDAHKEDYKSEPMIQARYLRFDPQAYASEVKVTDEQVKAYFEAHPDEFEEPERVEARHILFKVPADASKEAAEAVRRKAEEVLKQARSGKDFAELARQYSEDSTRERGGELGAFTHDQMVKPFADKAFSMEPGQISDPVRTQFGWHLIQVQKIHPASTPKLAAVQAQISKKLLEQKLRAKAREAADAAYDATFEKGDDLAKIGAVSGVSVQTTALFSRQASIEGVGDSSGFAAAAFKLPLDETSDVVELQDGFYLIKVTEIKPAAIQPLEAVRDKVRADWIKAEQEKKAAADAEAALKAVKAGQSLSESVGPFDLKVRSTTPFGRRGAIEGLGYEPAVQQAAFKLSDGQKYPDKPVRGAEGFFVIAFKARTTPDDSHFKAEKAAIIEQLRNQKSMQLFEQLMERLRASADIIIEPGFQE